MARGRGSPTVRGMMAAARAREARDAEERGFATAAGLDRAWEAARTAADRPSLDPDHAPPDQDHEDTGVRVRALIDWHRAHQQRPKA